MVRQVSPPGKLSITERTHQRHLLLTIITNNGLLVTIGVKLKKLFILKEKNLRLQKGKFQ